MGIKVYESNIQLKRERERETKDYHICLSFVLLYIQKAAHEQKNRSLANNVECFTYTYIFESIYSLALPSCQ
jgi:hypothetical protein